MIQPLPLLEIRPQEAPEQQSPPLHRFLVTRVIGFFLGQGAVVDGRILTRLWWEGEAQGPGEDRRREVLAALTFGDGDAGDGGEVVGRAVEEHA